jgi:hypothetical protein
MILFMISWNYKQGYIVHNINMKNFKTFKLDVLIFQYIISTMNVWRYPYPDDIEAN